MSFLVTWPADDPSTTLRHSTDPAEISSTLERLGCRFERREVQPAVGPDADSDTVLSAYRDTVDEIMAAEGFVAVDAITMHPSDDPDWLANAKAMRGMFIDEHTHSDHEVRFMVRGSTAFYLHIQDEVHAIHATAGDLIGVPRGTTHWVDSGPVPDFTVIRFFRDHKGWSGTPTGSDISHRFPDFDDVKARTE